MKTSLLTILLGVFAPVIAAHAQPINAPVTFKVAADAKIRAADNSIAKLTDLHIGQKVALAYQDNQGKPSADKIHIVAPRKAGAVNRKIESLEGQAKPDGELHTLGMITGTDVGLGTITVDVRLPKR